MHGIVNLKVPYVRQPANLGWCGAASAAMILKYYGERISQKRVAKEMPVSKRYGVYMPRLAIYFLKKGYDVTFKYWTPGIKPTIRGTKGGEDDLEVLEAFLGCLKYKKKPRNLKRLGDNRPLLLAHGLTDGDFLKLGGKVIFEPPFFRDIKNEICSGRPVILVVDANWLRKVGRSQSGHYIVIKGFRAPRRGKGGIPWLIFHDPSDKPNMSMRADELLYACHIWFGAAIFIKPRK